MDTIFRTEVHNVSDEPRVSKVSERLELAGRIILYVLAVLLPLWVLPGGMSIEGGRATTFGILIFVGTILWLAAILHKGELRYFRSPIVWIAFFFLAVAGIGALLSVSPIESFAFSPSRAETFVAVGLGILLMFFVGGVFYTPRQAERSLMLLVLSGGVSALITAAQIVFGFSAYEWFLAGAGAIDFNVIGTINGLAIFYTVLGVIGIQLAGRDGVKIWTRVLLFAALFFLFLDVFLIGFRTAWIVALGSSIVLLGFALRALYGAGTRFHLRRFLGAGLFVVSIVMIFAGPIAGDLGFPVEVTPSHRTTFKIGQAFFEEGTTAFLFGSGPGTFSFLWNTLKDPAINETIFWNVRFTQGSSWFLTTLLTGGLLGFSALVFLFIVSFIVFVRTLFAAARTVVSYHEAYSMYDGEEDVSVNGYQEVARGDAGGAEEPRGVESLLGLTALFIAGILYPSNSSFLFLFFLLLGLAAVSIGALGESSAGGWSGWLTVRERIARFGSSWSLFLSSLIAIFLLVVAAVGIFFEVNQLRAARAAEEGRQFLNAGDGGAALASFNRAVEIGGGTIDAHMLRVQGHAAALRAIINRAAAGEDVSAEFQSALADSVRDFNEARRRFPNEPALWQQQAALYEMMIPFVDGAENSAFELYQKAAELDPANPLVLTNWGRAELTLIDRLRRQMNQSRGEERKSFEKRRTEHLENAREILEKAIGLKSDFASAHFLLAQVAIRTNDLKGAIASAEQAKSAAPLDDIGVLFQLGVLYYQDNQLEKARAEFERAISFNEEYANARYFLGLIYDREGETERAIAEFEKIEALNPDNTEVKNILANLRAGKNALSDIVPPAEAPEARTEVPVE